MQSNIHSHIQTDTHYNSRFDHHAMISGYMTRLILHGSCVRRTYLWSRVSGSTLRRRHSSPPERTEGRTSEHPAGTWSSPAMWRSE